jgi:serine/threonine protein kinase
VLAKKVTVQAGGKTSFRIPPISDIVFETPGVDRGDVTYTIKNAPNGTFIDIATGALQGSPSQPGKWLCEIYAVQNTGRGALSERREGYVETIEITAENADTADASKGPRGKGCGPNGNAVDGVALDGQFTCTCHQGYGGDSCEINMRRVLGSIVGGVTIALFVVAIALLLYRTRAQSRKAHDFQGELNRLLSSGYLAAEQARNERVPREIKRANVRLSERLGAGQFGEVWKATLDESKIGGVPGYLVAVKMLTGEAGAEAASELLREATVMAQIEPHENIVAIVGVVTRGNPRLLLVPFCEKGSLLDVLRAREQASDPLGVLAKVRASVHVAAGMQHLVANAFVHRDLAARNVLMDSAMVCKVADFGLSRAGHVAAVAGALVAGEGQAVYYRSTRGVFALKWTAPEAMNELKFSQASDVWSFSVTLLEIFSDGREPFTGMSNQEVIREVAAGYRPPAPKTCPAEVYTLMGECWAEDPSMRPSFADIVSTFQRLGLDRLPADRLQLPLAPREPPASTRTESQYTGYTSGSQCSGYTPVPGGSSNLYLDAESAPSAFMGAELVLSGGDEVAETALVEQGFMHGATLPRSSQPAPTAPEAALHSKSKAKRAKQPPGARCSKCQAKTQFCTCGEEFAEGQCSTL